MKAALFGCLPFIPVALYVVITSKLLPRHHDYRLDWLVLIVATCIGAASPLLMRFKHVVTVVATCVFAGPMYFPMLYYFSFVMVVLVSGDGP